MIEATCSACGSVNRVPEADIPVGAKYVNCGSCKSRVALPSNTVIGPGMPKGPIMPPPRPPPMPPPTPGLSDLPAPKARTSTLGADASKPALAAAYADLPAPRGAIRPPPAPAAFPDPDEL